MEGNHRQPPTCETIYLSTYEKIGGEVFSQEGADSFGMVNIIFSVFPESLETCELLTGFWGRQGLQQRTGFAG